LVVAGLIPFRNSGIVGVVVSSIVSQRSRRKCPACLQRGLKQMSFVRAETVVDGKEQPDYRTYLRCERCGERFKLHDGMLTGVPEDEMTEATRFG
jgi:hypothetical protein